MVYSHFSLSLYFIMILTIKTKIVCCSYLRFFNFDKFVVSFKELFIYGQAPKKKFIYDKKNKTLLSNNNCSLLNSNNNLLIKHGVIRNDGRSAIELFNNFKLTKIYSKKIILLFPTTSLNLSRFFSTRKSQLIILLGLFCHRIFYT